MTSRKLLRTCAVVARTTVCALLVAGCCAVQQSSRTEWIAVAKDGKGFVSQPSGRPFTPWGFNYDHDERGRLIEDYWESEWAKVEEDFREMRQLGANIVRIHPQLAKFVSLKEGRSVSEVKPNDRALNQLRRLVQLSERLGLYLDVTGLGCYHKPDVPAWYDALSETERWTVQARFWQAVAGVCRDSPAIFCYDLMNEPVTPAGPRKGTDWLGPPFAGKHFVQWISQETKGRERPAIAREWIQRLTRAIREVDRRHLITVGLVPWSLPRPGLDSGFHPDAIAGDLDFISVHLYPERGKVSEEIETLKAFAVGKPVVVEETFPLKCSADELAAFIEQSRSVASGWIGFYWGRTPDELRASKQLADALMLAWLELFEKLNPNR
ncbi:MAG: glycoside hydrolase family 5 protein [Verrucomicrobia bacterium]|nr:glycoside hydrolase family 5 protein [Verrucomicrobiota bacterium]